MTDATSEGNEATGTTTALFTCNDPKTQGETVTFTNASIDATSYLWDFGDGSTSTETNPTHAFSTPGNNKVTLTAYGSRTDKYSKQVEITIAPIVVNFICNPLTGTGDKLISFTNTSSGYNYPTGYTYEWKIKKNARYTGSPSYKWTAISVMQHTAYTLDYGIYDVKLTVTNQWTNESTTKTGYITINQSLPSATFTANKTSGSRPLQVQFTSAYPYDVHTWDFGDDHTSKLIHPKHTYNTFGSFTVTHTVTNYAGSDEKTTTITVYNPLPKVNFGCSQPVKKGTTVTFINRSKYGNSYLWDFDDGFTSNEESPTHVFTEYGIRNIKLTVTNETGSAYLTKRVTIVGDVVITPFI